jgi:hypothetical protein
MLQPSYYAVLEPLGNNIDGQAFRLAVSLLARRSIAHHAGKLEGFRNPAAVVFAVQLD